MNRLRQMQQPATSCNNTASPQLKAKQFQAAALVASGNTDEAIAEELGIDRSTVWRWRTRSPSFQAEVNRHRESLNASISDKLRETMLAAVGTMAELLATSADQTIRLKAATVLLQLVPHSLEPGPTDPREIMRPLAEQRQADMHDLANTLKHAMEGTKAVITLCDEMVLESDSAATFS